MIEHQVVEANWSLDVEAYIHKLGDKVVILKLVGGPNPAEPQAVKKAGRLGKRIKQERTSAKKGDAGVRLPVAESTPVTEEQKAIILNMAAERKTHKEINGMLKDLTRKQIRETLKSANAPGTGNPDPNLFRDE